MQEEAVEAQATTKSQSVPAVLRLSRGGDVKSATSSAAKEEWLEAFETDFWGGYPRKVGKFMARKAWLRVTPWTQETVDEIFAGLDRWNAHWRDSETERRFIPYPATWLNQHRWEDEPDA